MVADLDGDGRKEIVVGGSGSVAAYTLRHGRLRVKPGWPASVRSGGQTPEVRGLAAADLNHDGRVEVVATTTNTSPSGAQVFVFNSRGKRFQPKHGHHPAWPRYNRLSGQGNDLHFNGVGNHGYGAYGENVGIGNIDNDRNLEIITTFDNHQINAFNLDGTSILASKWFTNRESSAEGRRMGWGQFIRWASTRASSGVTTTSTPDSGRARPASRGCSGPTSPPTVADLDSDGRNEVIGIPNVERHIPYRTQGLRLHGAGRRLRRRAPIGHAGTKVSRSFRCPTTRVHRPRR